MAVKTCPLIYCPWFYASKPRGRRIGPSKIGKKGASGGDRERWREGGRVYRESLCWRIDDTEGLFDSVCVYFPSSSYLPTPLNISNEVASIFYILRLLVIIVGTSRQYSCVTLTNFVFIEIGSHTLYIYTLTQKLTLHQKEDIVKE